MSKVAVIGGGPAGMMAAIAAAGQGHEVSLWEKK
jgi:predicted flavoprotein YhiN